MPNVIDLFCGVGGFSYGFMKSGYEVLLGIDNNEQKLKTYSKNIPAKYINKNIITLDINEIKENLETEEIDVIVGSPPCQSFSPSNQNKMKEEIILPDLILLYNYFRVIAELKPKFFIIENVNNYFNSNQIKIIFNLFNLYGYTTSTSHVKAEEFGIPQVRSRGFLVGNLFSQSIKAKPKINNSPISLEEAIGDLKNVTPSKNDDLNPIQIPMQIFSNYQISMHREDRKIYNHIDPGNKASTIKKISSIEPGSYYGKNSSHIRSSSDNVSKVITRGFGSPSNDGETMHYEKNRCLTYREAARIQSFDDNFIFITEGIKREEIRKMIGDAVPPLLAYHLAKIIEQYL